MFVFVSSQLLLHQRLDPYWGLGAQTEVEPIEKVHRFDCSVEMSEVEEVVWPLPPVSLARIMHNPGYVSPWVRSIDWQWAERIRHSIDQEKG